MKPQRMSFNLKGWKILPLLNAIESIAVPYKILEMVDPTSYSPLGHEVICEYRNEVVIKTSTKEISRKDLKFGVGRMDEDTRLLYEGQYKDGFIFKGLPPYRMTEDITLWSMLIYIKSRAIIDEEGNTFFRLIKNMSSNMAVNRARKAMNSMIHATINAIVNEIQQGSLKFILKTSSFRIARCPSLSVYSKEKDHDMKIPFECEETIETTVEELKLLDELLHKTSKGVSSLIAKGKDAFDRKHYKGAFDSLVFKYNPILLESIKAINEKTHNDCEEMMLKLLRENKPNVENHLKIIADDYISLNDIILKENGV